MMPLKRHSGFTISREKAARLLRAARAAGPEHAGEAIGWAMCALPESRQVRRLKIDYLLSTGQYDSADALVARSIMHGMDHPLIRLRWAQSMFDQNRPAQADIEIRRVLQCRPNHIKALLLASEISSRLGDRHRAIEMLARVTGQRPESVQIQHRLIQALLEAGLVEDAARMLATLADRPVILHARVSLAQRRTLEAMELLEEAAFSPDQSFDREALFCELIDVLEQTGDMPRLRALCDYLLSTQAPGSTILSEKMKLRAAQAMLVLGDCGHAAAWIGDGATGRAALDVRVVAASLAGQTARASDALRQFSETAQRDSRIAPVHQGQGSTHGPDPRPMARQWLRGLLGRMIVDQTDARHAGADPSMGLLEPMLRDAAEVLDAALAENQSHPHATALERCRVDCLQAIHRSSHIVGMTSTIKTDGNSEPTTRTAGPEYAPASRRVAA